MQDIKLFCKIFAVLFYSDKPPKSLLFIEAPNLDFRLRNLVGVLESADGLIYMGYRFLNVILSELIGCILSISQ